MKTMSGTIVFFGNERIATGVSTKAPVLRSLIDAGYTIAAVVAHYEHGKSRNARGLEVAEIARQHNIPLLLPDKLSDISGQLKSFNAVAGVLVAYGKIIPQSTIDIFPKGIINIHPSLLPLHRGPTPLESVILDGSINTGVSLMKLSKAMDAGPIYAQSEVKLTGDESKQSLADVLLEVGSTMLTDLLPEIINGAVVAVPQDESAASYDSLITKAAGILDWQKPAGQLEREIRAYLEWPKSQTTLGDLPVIITAAKVADRNGKPGSLSIDNKQLFVGCGEKALQILKLKPAGKSEMTTEAFLAGYGSKL
jgi:methionyl-tRNA formyltransferase